MCGDQVSLAADVATVIACFVAGITVVVGTLQFITTQKSLRETQAVELFLKFNQLNIEQSLSSSQASDNWYNNSKFAITESLFNVAYKSESWINTVKWMLGQQIDFIRGGGFEVESYSVKFRSFCIEHKYELKP